MFELADELTETRLGELLRVELLRALVQGVVRVDGTALAVLLVEKAEVINRELRRGLLVEGCDLVQHVDGLFVAAFCEQELGPVRR